METICFDSHGVRCAGCYLTAATDELTTPVRRDLIARASGRDPVTVPIVGPVGSHSIISAPEAETGYQAIMGPTFRSEMCARGLLRVAANRPVRHAKPVRCLVLLIVAGEDNIAPVSAVYEVGRRLGTRAEVHSYPVGHFDIYVGEVFEKSVAVQTEFLRRVLA